MFLSLHAFKHISPYNLFTFRNSQRGTGVWYYLITLQNGMYIFIGTCRVLVEYLRLSFVFDNIRGLHIYPCSILPRYQFGIFVYYWYPNSSLGVQRFSHFLTLIKYQ